jgi:hypothetical protein
LFGLDEARRSANILLVAYVLMTDHLQAIGRRS